MSCKAKKIIKKKESQGITWFQQRLCRQRHKFNFRIHNKFSFRTSKVKHKYLCYRTFSRKNKNFLKLWAKPIYGPLNLPENFIQILKLNLVPIEYNNTYNFISIRHNKLKTHSLLKKNMLHIKTKIPHIKNSMLLKQ